MTTRRINNSGANVQRHRDKMRARGFRLLQIWVPDTRSSEFAEECRRQSLRVAADPAERALMDELEAMLDLEGWSV